MKLWLEAIGKFLLGVVLVGALLFLPAGTLNFWQGFLLMGILFLSMPLVLGSVYSLLIFLFYPFLIAKRIRGEEAFLAEHLAGYREYQQKVRYRLIPFVW